jgi:hypothetical protein
MPIRPAAAFAALLLAGALPAQAPPPVAEQLAAAVLPLPAELRDGATVLGYREAGALVTLRQGTNGLTCLALYVTRPDFHVACYADGLEPFMARGRQLRAQGVQGTEVDSVRFRELRSGALTLPPQGALYSITGDKADFDAATATLRKGSTLTVLYIPGATTASTGISSRPSRTGAWLMFPGTPKAHVMISGQMSP